MKPETTGCCFLPEKDCGHGGDFDTLGYMFITSCLVSSRLCCWRFSRVAASKNRCWMKSECKIAGIKETKELGLQAGVTAKWRGVRTAPDRRKGWWIGREIRAGDDGMFGAQTLLTEDAGTWARRKRAITMAQLEGMAINGRKKFEMWGLAKCRVKGNLFTGLYWKRMGALGKSSFELDVER